MKNRESVRFASILDSRFSSPAEMKTVYLLATLDTKGVEAAFVRDQLAPSGCGERSSTRAASACPRSRPTSRASECSGSRARRSRRCAARATGARLSKAAAQGVTRLADRPARARRGRGRARAGRLGGHDDRHGGHAGAAAGRAEGHGQHARLGPGRGSTSATRTS